MTSNRVLVVGTAECSGGGVSSVIRLIKKMPVWEKYQCYWLGTQIQASKWVKLRYAITSYLKAFFIVWRCKIVHFHTVPNVSMMVQLPVFILARLAGKKIILHLHVGNQLTMPHVIEYKLAHWCMRKADLLVLLSNQFASYLDQYWSDVKTPIKVIYNACDHVKAIPYERHKPTILFCGRFTDNKSADMLIKAFGKIYPKHPDWRLQFLAEGPEEHKCRQLVKDFGLESNVEMPGFLYGEAKADYFRHAGIFCLCSHFEGFPMVVLEAWAYGVPVVSTFVGALPEIVTTRETGLLYDVDDVEKLSELLDELMSDESLRRSMSVYGKEYVETHFSLETINGQIEEMYQNLLK